ncbi:hypothetical protein ACN27G_02165 [Plantactinospora sp. WMMB334]|uniref:hypothetical protein n=1 Tax=Plantactinospora sp. WMMB334 TaxID=3404119 RepID=UPI003B94E948
MTAVEFTSEAPNDDARQGPLIIVEVERFAPTGIVGQLTIGQLRQRVDQELDRGIEVCLVSTVPRVSYFPTVGSSLIEDASFFCIPLLEENECTDEGRASPGFPLPGIGFGIEAEITTVFRDALQEIGVGVLAALDHVLFEVESRIEFLDLLEPREFEALRGAGLAYVEGTSPKFVVPQRLNEFSEAVADVLADVVEPQKELAQVSDGLWFIERTIRCHLRRAALSKFGSRWRRQVLHGDLASRVLERARNDVNVTATSVGGLRDPIEWLSLGELLEIVQSSAFGGLKFDNMSWQRFAQDVIPIRNRLSHMRLIKKGDHETVMMWVSRVRRAFI